MQTQTKDFMPTVIGVVVLATLVNTYGTWRLGHRVEALHRPAAVAPARFVDASVDDDAIKGDVNAPVTIIEFTDYECPFCGRYYAQTQQQIIERYVETGVVKMVVRDFPLTFHEQAQKAGEAAECAGEQGHYWAMHDRLFENQASLGVEQYKRWAGELGLDQSAFGRCLDSGAMADEVQADHAEGVDYGITGTPVFFVNGKMITGAQPFAVFEAAIEDALDESP